MSWIEKTIAPKSDQLNAEDLLTGPITVTVKSVRQGSAEQPAIIEIDGGRQPYKPCKTMRRVLIACWTSDVDSWTGRRMTLFCDPTVKWAGEEIGGIRISHLSHIDGEKILKLSESKGKRKGVRILPLKSEKKPEQIDDPVLNRHREPFAGAPKPVLTLSGKIAKAYKASDVDSLQKFESEIQSHPEEWQGVLNAFLSDVLETLAKGTE